MKWDSDSLWLKAKVYIDRANSLDHEDEEFALRSALALEFLARAALTKIHPVLNADPKEDVNLLYALGYDLTGRPRSIPIHSVYLRLEKIFPAFGKVQRELCDYLAHLRNEEIHTGELAFQGLKESEWLPRFYEVCRILGETLGYELQDFLGADLAVSAEKLIEALNKELEGSVKSKVAAHAKVFLAKEAKEKSEAGTIAAATARAMEREGVTVQRCPACGFDGALEGDLIKELPPKYEDEMLVVDQEFLATAFKCSACNLSLANVAEVTHAGIEPRFVQQRETELHELFQPEYDDAYMNM